MNMSTSKCCVTPDAIMACSAAQVLYRRAQAHLLQQHFSEAAADCQAASAAAQECGAPTAAIQDCQQLLAHVQAAELLHNSTGQGRCTASALAASQHKQQHSVLGQLPVGPSSQKQLSKEQPPSGCSLQQLDMLLAYLQQQAQDLLNQQQQQQQQQQHGHGLQAMLVHSTDTLLQQQYRQEQQQYRQAAEKTQYTQQEQQEQQQRQQDHGPSIRCRYSAAKGRHLVAARDIPAGAVLLAELPLAAVAVRPKRQTQVHGSRVQQQQQQQGRCSWCFGPLRLVIWPCCGCPLVSLQDAVASC